MPVFAFMIVAVVVLGLLRSPLCHSIDGPIPAEYGLPGLAVLTPFSQALGCAGLHLSPSLIVTAASCVREHATLEWAMFPTEDGDELQPKRSFSLSMDKQHRLPIERTEIHSAYSDNHTAAAVASDIALVRLAKIRSPTYRHLSSSALDADVPLQQQLYDQDSLVVIDLAQQQGFVMHPVVYVDNALCQLGPRQDKRKTQALCLLLVPAQSLRFGATTLAILGSPANAAACLGIQIAPRLVLTSASCILMRRPITYVRFMSPTVWAPLDREPSKGDVFRSRLRLTEPEVIQRTFVSPGKTALLAVVQLRDPRRDPDHARVAILPRTLLPPAPNRRHDGTALVFVDPVSLHVSVTEHVVFVGAEFCGQRAANQSLAEARSVCVIPLVKPPAQGMAVDTAGHWSFLIRRVGDRAESDALLGFGDSSTLWYGVFRAFTWISPEISPWLNDTAFPGVHIRRLQ
ncbi:hypothetical protein P43SY_009236 [Pythium insidiosum]|uniref:Peptidase S1 domain-containing protein n=1 Tax=Pythium insidiosum TaxID=114742 RepID=A0AAD5Q9V8_PYTIN|nr:hypothetical protein P43SY_009236 [Pythium insidiosum]